MKNIDADKTLQVINHTIEGYKLVKVKQCDEALKVFNKAIKLNPKFAFAHTGRGHALLHLGRYEESILEYDWAIKFNPEYAGSYHCKGMALKNLKRYNEALKAFNHAIDLDNQNKETFIEKGNLLYELQQFEEAIIAYDRVIGLQPDSILVYQKKGEILQHFKRYEEAIVMYDQALSFKTTNIFRTQSIMLSKIQVYIEQNKWYEAEAILENPQLGELREEYKDTWNVLQSRCAFGKGEYEKSLKYCDDAIKLDNNMLSTALHTKILCLSALDKRDAIITAENEGLQKNMNDGWILMSKAIRKINEGDLKGADSYFRRGQRFGGIGGEKTLESEICYFLMRAIQLIVRGEYWEALQSINDALAHDLEFERKNLLRHKAIVLNKLEYFEEALSCCNEFLANDSSNIEILAEKAEALQGLGKYSASKAIIGILKSQLSVGFKGAEKEKHGQVLKFPRRKKD